MAAVSYIAKRNLKGGVSVDDPIDFDFEVSQVNRATKPIGGSQVSLSGYEETVRDRTDEFYTLVTVPVLEASFDDFRQFLDSVDGGEMFTLDPYGTIASPVQAMNCIMAQKGYKEKRVSQRYLSVSFKVRVHP